MEKEYLYLYIHICNIYIYMYSIHKISVIIGKINVVCNINGTRVISDIVFSHWNGWR